MEAMERFAERCKVKVRRDVCGNTSITGKRLRAADGQSDIFEGYDGGRLGVALLFATKQKWNKTRHRLEAAGFVVRQNGDTEGILTFDPENEAQAKMAIKTAGVRVKRRTVEPSPAQIAHRERFAAMRRQAVAA